MLNIRLLSIKHQLGLFALLALVFVLGVTLTSVFTASQVMTLTEKVDKVRGPNLLNAQRLVNAVNARAVGVRNLTLATTPEGLKTVERTVLDAHAEVGRQINTLQDPQAHASESPTERQLREALIAAEAVYAPIAVNITRVAASGDKTRAALMIAAECQPALDALLKAAQAFVAYEGSSQAQDIALANATSQRGIQTQWFVFAASAVLLLGAGYVITKGLVNSSQAAVNGVNQLAQGDLSVRFQAEGRSEPALVLAAVNDMAAKLREAMGTVRDAASQIATASEEVAMGTLDLSSRTEQAASSLEETASSMEELTSTVKHTSEAARQADQLASSSAQEAEQSGTVVQRVIATMADINQSSAKMSEIIGVIDGIAFQTNILALNAAVEAARAGEQGRGFAVVAGEVRTLAQRSAQAAKEVKQLIDDSVSKVTAGTRLVDDAGATLTSAVASARQVSSIVASIMSATSEQADGIGQVNVAVAQMDQVTQQNAALVEQSTAAAASLKEQTARLNTAVRFFKFA
ncbi:MAG: methyl-accepting chemotaxis protein [Burkholderiaceae bacterium]